MILKRLLFSRHRLITGNRSWLTIWYILVVGIEEKAGINYSPLDLPLIAVSAGLENSDAEALARRLLFTSKGDELV